jgi:hypothetical protein
MRTILNLYPMHFTWPYHTSEGATASFSPQVYKFYSTPFTQTSLKLVLHLSLPYTERENYDFINVDL